MRPVLGLHLILLVAGLHFSILASAQCQSELPTAADLFAKAISATGSEEAIKNLKSIRCEGKIKISEELDATSVLIKLRNGKGLQELDVRGNIFAAYVNGRTAWTSNANVHASIPEVHAVYLQIMLQPLLPLEYQKYFDEVRTTGPAKLEGVKCYEVECKRKGKPFVTYYFAQETGLEAGYAIEATSGPEGDVSDATIVYQDYREVSGLKLPHRILFQYPSYDQAYTMDKIIVNGEVDEKEFEIPKDLK